jgi:hypothetical protein
MDLPRYIDIPVERETPEWVLSRLREVDPMAELFYAGDGWWWLGVVKPGAPRCMVGRKTLDFWADKGIEQPWPVMRTEILKAQGFGLVAKTKNGDQDPDWGAVVEDFRKCDWIYRNWGTPNETVRRQIEESGVLDDEMRLKARAATIERLQADERYLFSRLVRQNSAPVPVGVDLK